jgi:hypothetical protein
MAKKKTANPKVLEKQAKFNKERKQPSERVAALIAQYNSQKNK